VSFEGLVTRHHTLQGGPVPGTHPHDREIAGLVAGEPVDIAIDSGQYLCGLDELDIQVRIDQLELL
jgi:hypothetical protein